MSNKLKRANKVNSMNKANNKTANNKTANNKTANLKAKITAVISIILIISMIITPLISIVL